MAGRLQPSVFKQLSQAAAPTSAVCAKLTTNMTRQQWRDRMWPDIDYIKVCPGLDPVVALAMTGLIPGFGVVFKLWSADTGGAVSIA